MYRELLLSGYLKFYEPYLLLTNDYKHSVELFMHSKQITRIQQLQRYSV